MNFSTRRVLAVVLIVGSLLAAAIIHFATGDLIQWRTLGETEGGVGKAHWTVSTTLITVRAQYVVPLIVCFTAGALCLFLPPRRQSG